MRLYYTANDQIDGNVHSRTHLIELGYNEMPAYIERVRDNIGNEMSNIPQNFQTRGKLVL